MPAWPTVNDRAHAELCGVLPPKFQGFVGVYPQAVFRPMQLDTQAIEGVSIFVDGQLVPCDGSSYQLHSCALALGNALVLDVVSELPEPVLFKATLHGLTVDTERDEIAHGLKLGAKALRPKRAPHHCDREPG